LIKKLLRVFAGALQQFFADQCTQAAAGIAYRLLFSIAPLAIVLVSIFGLVLQDEAVRANVVKTIVDALPFSASGSKDVEDAITNIASPASAAGLISLLIFAWAASGAMTSIRLGLERAMGVTDGRPMARGKLIDFALIIGTAVLVIVTVGLTVLDNFVEKGARRVADALGLGAAELGTTIIHLSFFALAVVVVLLLYRFVPARGLSPREGLVGAIVTAVLLQLISLASSIILRKTSQLSVIYGTLTAALVFLYSMYLYSSALLLGAEVARAWNAPVAEGPAEPLGRQLRRALFGLFVRQDPAPPPSTTADTPTPRPPDGTRP
jgi:membrane protein